MQDSELSLLEYSLSFVLNTKEIDLTLVGVSNSSQLTEIIQASNLNLDLKAYGIDDINILNPSLWKL